ncbi:glycosyltransferase [Candidatus Microgenomates bacterium]|nr:glycosyltransferase [Candidatus Microgenomates bacterium]
MKILMLVPFLPNDQLSGGQTRWYNLIRHLSKQHKITLMTLIKDDWEKKFVPELEKYCEEVLVFKRPKSPWTFRNLFLTLISFNPLVVVRNFSLEERRAVKKELAKHKYDLIHAETFYVMPHIPKTKIPIILVEPTIEFSVYQHYVDHEVPWFLKPIYLFDVAKLRFWEKYYWKKANKSFAVSEDDKKVMEKEAPGLNAGVVSNGVDYKHFQEKMIIKKDPPRILYVGDFKWMQNVEAVNILVEKIWPEVKTAVPGVKLWLNGMNVPSNISDYSKKDSDIEITQGVPDIRDVYKSSTVLVAPIKGPGGTRLKVLEAMASGLPVVSTPVGVSGLGLTKGRDALVSSSEEELAKITIKVLTNDDFATKIGNNGKEFVKNNFDWIKIVDKLNKVYEETKIK